MTTETYIKLYAEAHARNGKISLETMKILQGVFKEAGKLASDQVLKTTTAGLSDLTSTAWSQINKQLIAGADLIAKATEKEIPLTISKAYQNIFNIDSDYIIDAVTAAGVTEITKAGIKNIGVGVNFDLLKIQADRIYSDGYSFSDRVWSVDTILAKNGITKLPSSIHGDYQHRIKNLILTGQAQGRDVVEIADDIGEYLAKGKDFVFKEGRYGRLIPGTAQYKRRISRFIDWRALRLVRSELNASLQEAGLLEGRVNPGATDLFDWIKTAGFPIDIKPSQNVSGKSCIALQRGSPYKASEIDFYNHPNCSCSKRPVLRDADTFLKDLNEWEPGEGDSYLENWFQNIYKPTQ